MMSLPKMKRQDNHPTRATTHLRFAPWVRLVTLALIDQGKRFNLKQHRLYLGN